MSQTNLYELLGVAPDADERTIKRAFRAQARLHHPDLNPGDASANERFIEIAAAFEVLSEPDRRALYDEFGLEGLQEGFNVGEARRRRERERRRERPTYSFDPKKSSIFSNVFGEVFRNSSFMRSAFEDLKEGVRAEWTGTVPESSGARPEREDADAQPAPDPEPFETPEPEIPPELRGADRFGTLAIPSLTAIQGGSAVYEHEGELLVVRIPAGVEDGEELVVPGEGEPPPVRDGYSGDLRLTIEIEHLSGIEGLARDGLDLTLQLPISFSEALLGARVTVPTPHGDCIVTLPEGISSGTRLRLRNMGVKRGDTRGDFYVVVEIHAPTRITDAMRDAVRVLDEGYTTSIREHIKFSSSSSPSS